jgi:hypothetical protein
MTGLLKFVSAAFVVALICSGIGVITARAWGALWPTAVHSVHPDSNPGVADPDYVQGLAKRGIVKLPVLRASAGRSN